LKIQHGFLRVNYRYFFSISVLYTVLPSISILVLVTVLGATDNLVRPVGGVFEQHFIFAPGDGNLTNQKLKMSNAREREWWPAGGYSTFDLDW